MAVVLRSHRKLLNYQRLTSVGQRSALSRKHPEAVRVIPVHQDSVVERIWNVKVNSVIPFSLLPGDGHGLSVLNPVKVMKIVPRLNSGG